MKTTSIIRVLSIMFILACAGIFLPAGTAWADEPYSEATVDTGDNNAVLTGIEIGGVEAPKAGEEFDTSATVTAGNGETWEIPVFWLGPQEEPAAVVNLEDQVRPLMASDGSLWKFIAFENEAAEGEAPSMYAAFNVTTMDGRTVALPVYPVQDAAGGSQPAGQGVYYRPLLVYSIPDGRTSSGIIALDSYLAGVFNMSGGIISIPDRDSGITYITGMVRASALSDILKSIGSVGVASAGADTGTESEAAGAADTGTESEAAGAAGAKPKTLPPLDPTVIRPAGVPEFPFGQETFAR